MYKNQCKLEYLTMHLFKRTNLVVCFSLIGFAALAQTPDTLIARQYFEQATVLQDSAQYDSSSLYFEKAALIYESVENWEKNLKCKNRICENLLRQRKLGEAQALAEKTLEENIRYLEKGNLEEARVYYNIGTLHSIKGDIEKSLEY